MDIFTPPQWLLDALPEQASSFLQNGGWLAVLGGAALLGLIVLAVIANRILKALGGKKKDDDDPLLEDLDAIPPPAPSTGDRRLQIEGVPVRLRLVVVAPAGHGHDVHLANTKDYLNRVVTGLGDIAAHDKPVMRLWPLQYSDEGFANMFHTNTPTAEGDNEPSRWVLVAGRAQLGKQPIFVGLGLQAIKPTTLGRLRAGMHEWPSLLRIRTKD